MPAKSEKQQKLMALALHKPNRVRRKNRGVLKMSRTKLEEFVGTKKKRKRAK